ncbi:MAG: pyruvate, phosphate dikinase, partial [Sneathiella sp.]
MTKWVYSFGDGTADGAAEMRNLLGGKGANLAEMSNLGLPVPSGFTLSTEVCTSYYDNDCNYPKELTAQIDAAIEKIENSVGFKFGDKNHPLLVSVRSGARASMPGMMDTVLNLGLNDETVEGLAKQSGDRRFAFDSYRRFIQMYSDVVLEVEHYHFEELLEILKEENGYSLDTDLSADDWEKLVGQFKAKVEEELGRPFPQNVQDQLWGATSAVFGSWMNQRAITYRRLNDIPAAWGTAVNIQAMVFGNMGDDSATGVAFTRDPSTGEKLFYGEFLVNAQGEDVVAGIRTPQNLTKQSRIDAGSDAPSMEELFPEVFGELVDVYLRLEAHYRDMQDIEFTVQQGKLWMLQTRSGKRTAKAALQIAIDMVSEDLISKEEAIKRIEPSSLDQLLHPTLDPSAERNIIARGLPASPGAASGQIVFTSDEAEILANEGKSVILVRVETSPEDIHGMHAAKGILTSRGGMTSHAAVVARGMGRACVSGAGSLNIDYREQTLTVLGQVFNKGDIITIDGGTGEVMVGAVDTILPELSGTFGVLMGWADEIRRMKIRTNAETPLDAETARKFGAEGIGLCRTEHMFFDADRIVAVRQMILAEDLAERQIALAKLLPVQRADFVELFRIMAGLPVTVRLLDPPLHEFLPKTDEEIDDLAAALGADAKKLRHRALQLHEFNPMLGHRGCRLGISYPEIYEMQARAILEAAATVSKELGDTVVPEIMIPLVATDRELEILKEKIAAVAKEISEETGKEVDYLI